ncbi:hypothetical protein EVAR_39351_1 [Eumeta japonica]|uniref:Uncharacterized protein n=1 Tax=Eumeta variegata TaxID=151549 RepID=A0A4C1WP89_EUMVA|nr:hypothetical protein EVAR_39351_1 [Eumeta japonica]
MSIIEITNIKALMSSEAEVIGALRGTDDLLLPHARASSHRGYDPDGSSGDGPLSGIQFMEFSRFNRRSRGGVSGFTVIFLDRQGQLWEYDEVVGRRSVRTGEIRQWRTSTIRKKLLAQIENSSSVGELRSLPSLEPPISISCGRAFEGLSSL